MRCQGFTARWSSLCTTGLHHSEQKAPLPLEVIGRGPTRTRLTYQCSPAIWGCWAGPYQVLSRMLRSWLSGVCCAGLPLMPLSAGGSPATRGHWTKGKISTSKVLTELSGIKETLSKMWSIILFFKVRLYSLMPACVIGVHSCSLANVLYFRIAKPLLYLLILSQQILHNLLFGALKINLHFREENRMPQVLSQILM